MSKTHTGSKTFTIKKTLYTSMTAVALLGAGAASTGVALSQNVHAATSSEIATPTYVKGSDGFYHKKNAYNGGIMTETNYTKLNIVVKSDDGKVNDTQFKDVYVVSDGVPFGVDIPDGYAVTSVSGGDFSYVADRGGIAGTLTAGDVTITVNITKSTGSTNGMGADAGTNNGQGQSGGSRDDDGNVTDNNADGTVTTTDKDGNTSTTDPSKGQEEGTGSTETTTPDQGSTGTTPTVTVDKAMLDANIDSYQSMTSEGYTADTFAKVTSALANGKKVSADANASQATVDAATKAIQDAISGLKLTPDQTITDPDTDTNADPDAGTDNGAGSEVAKGTMTIIFYTKNADGTQEVVGRTTLAGNAGETKTAEVPDGYTLVGDNVFTLTDSANASGYVEVSKEETETTKPDTNTDNGDNSAATGETDTSKGNGETTPADTNTTTDSKSNGSDTDTSVPADNTTSGDAKDTSAASKDAKNDDKGGAASVEVKNTTTAQSAANGAKAGSKNTANAVATDTPKTNTDAKKATTNSKNTFPKTGEEVSNVSAFGMAIVAISALLGIAYKKQRN